MSTIRTKLLPGETLPRTIPLVRIFLGETFGVGLHAINFTPDNPSCEWTPLDACFTLLEKNLDESSWNILDKEPTFTAWLPDLLAAVTAAHDWLRSFCQLDDHNNYLLPAHIVSNFNTKPEE